MGLYSLEESYYSNSFGGSTYVVNNIWNEIDECDLHDKRDSFIEAGYKCFLYTKWEPGITRCFISKLTKEEMEVELERRKWIWGTWIYNLEQ